VHPGRYRDTIPNPHIALSALGIVPNSPSFPNPGFGIRSNRHGFLKFPGGDGIRTGPSMIVNMPIDDNPIEILRKRFEFEDLSKSPVSEVLVRVGAELSRFLSFPSPLQSVMEAISDKIRTEGVERIGIMLKTVADEVLKHDREIKQIQQAQSAGQERVRREQEARLVVDGARRVFNTRSIARVQRIGLILAHCIASPLTADEDEIEEMMRIATELTDMDVAYLRELVSIQGQYLDGKSHVERFTAYQSWVSGPWGERIDPALDSVFHKLESFGLVSAIAPNNTFNISADIQTRFVLLPKGKRFAQLIRV
jgi:hypothetical protein